MDLTRRDMDRLLGRVVRADELSRMPKREMAVLLARRPDILPKAADKASLDAAGRQKAAQLQTTMSRAQLSAAAAHLDPAAAVTDTSTTMACMLIAAGHALPPLDPRMWIAHVPLPILDRKCLRARRLPSVAPYAGPAWRAHRAARRRVRRGGARALAPDAPRAGLYASRPGVGGPHEPPARRHAHGRRARSPVGAPHGTAWAT